MAIAEVRKIVCGNGHAIAASVFAPDAEARASVLIVPAMGIGQEYYAPMAAWLASQGLVAATFDYSGTGRSRCGDLREHTGNVADWARFDCSAMIDALDSMHPGRPIYWLGHSLGGQILGFVPNRVRIRKIVTVASGSGYWLENVPALKWKVWFLWYAVGPVATRLCGYFPGRRLNMVGDLPRGVMRQWRSWCLHPEYAVGVEGDAIRAQFAEVRVPIVSISFTDDEMMSARNIESLHGFYVGAPRTMHRIHPGDVGAKRIGHFGFFREAFRDSLWPRYLLPELN